MSPILLACLAAALPALAEDAGGLGGAGARISGMLGQERGSPPVPGLTSSEAGPVSAFAVVDTGHGSGIYQTQYYSRENYNIWSRECHTAANTYVAQAKYAAERQGLDIKAGIVACGGNPEASQAHHTLNWAVSEKENKTCLL